MHRLDTLIPPPGVLAALGAIAWLVARYLPAFSFHLPFTAGISIAIAAVGLALNLHPKRAFQRAGTTVNPLRPTSATRLVTSGVYRYTRNPMYLGHALILFGWTLHLRNGVALLAVPAFVLYIARFQIRPEERILSMRFGEDYAAFCRRVRRWL